MFKKLTEFNHKRTSKEALGFYLAYLLLIVILSALIGGIFGLVIGEGSIELGMRLGGFVAVVVCLVISFMLLSKKNLMYNFGMLLLALLSGLLAFFGGGILGLIPVAYLSTK